MAFQFVYVPPRPFKNFDAYVNEWRRRFSDSASKEKEAPCRTCRGCGRVRKFKDRDPIEGYKLAPWYDCANCQGTGTEPGGMEALKTIYKADIKDWQERHRKALIILRKQKIALNKVRAVLSREELDLLNLGKVIQEG